MILDLLSHYDWSQSTSFISINYSYNISTVK